MSQVYRCATPRILAVTDPVEESHEFYSWFYTKNKDDSPDDSRILLQRRLGRYIAKFGEDDCMLDLGAGRQALEKGYIAPRGKVPPFKIVTLDIAELSRKQLLADRYGVMHVKANGSQLPFYNDQFSLVVSNMALDFMPRDAISEAYRVLRPGHYAIVNLHHPSLIPANLDELLENEKIAGRQRNKFRKSWEVLLFWKYLRDNSILFANSNEIRARFGEIGFEIKSVDETKTQTDTWWEVDLFKPEKIKLKENK